MSEILIEFRTTLLDLLIFVENIGDIYLVLTLILFSIFFLSIPIPGSFVVMINAFFLGFYGFFISLVGAIISSLILYILINNLNWRFKFPKKYKYFIKQKNNLYLLTLARIIIPYPLCSYLMSLIKIDIKLYILASIFGSFPGTFTISLFFSSIRKSFLNDGSINIVLFQNKVFLSSILLMLILVIFTNYINKKLNKK